MISKAFCRFVLCSLLGLLLACSLPIVPTIAQQSPLHSLNRAQILNQQGQQQLERGDPQAALERWSQAETLYRQLGNQTGAIGTQLNQAKALQALGFYPRAKALLEQVVASQQQQPNSLLKANSLLTLGNVLRLIGDYKTSQNVLTASLRMAQQLNSLPDRQAAHLHLGNTLLAQQQLPAALAQFTLAAAIDGTLKLSAQLHQLKLLQQLNRPAEATTLLSQIEAQLETSPVSQLAIYGQIELADMLMKGKHENTNPQERPSLSPPPLTPPSHPSPLTPSLKAAQLLATAAQQAKTLGDRRAQSYAIGRLGQLYEQTQQWTDAKRLTQEALQLARGVNVPEILYQWQWQMGRILYAKGDIAGATIAYTEAVDTLQSLRNDLVAIGQGQQEQQGQEVQFSFRDKVEPVYRELVDLLLQPTAMQTNLSKARQVIESLQLAELNNFFRETCLEAEARSIDTVDPTAAVIYPVILRDRLEVILSLPGQPLQHYATSRSKDAIEAGIEQMQASLRLTSFAQERLTAAQQIYAWLIKPAAVELAQHDIKTLVFVLDGSLRNLPMAALHDGKQYLIEQYQIALTPGLQLFSPRTLQREQIRALVGGLSEGVAGASPLPGVQQEVNQIRRQVSAQVLLNRSFTNQALTSQVQQQPFTVVHLATHGQFSSKVGDTYIQTWDGRLDIDALRTLLKQHSTAAIELLVLSACETATGDDRAALGMAGVAVRSGARSTLATLWTVNDASTATFIAAFYKALTQPGVSKAQAVQQAQAALIQSQAFSHPFYWAPFILVGNWL